MIFVENTIVSDEIKNTFFVCNLEKCKGACCVEGDLGAPLTKEEINILDSISEKITPFISNEGAETLKKQGNWVLDEDNDFSTPLMENGVCAYAIYDKKNILKCGLEDAYNKNVTNFKKPISCHLYPIRINQYNDFIAVNYHEWNICNDACILGEKLQIPLYEFLKEPLIRRFGEKWYKDLLLEIKEM